MMGFVSLYYGLISACDFKSVVTPRPQLYLCENDVLWTNFSPVCVCVCILSSKFEQMSINPNFESLISLISIDRFLLIKLKSGLTFIMI